MLSFLIIFNFQMEINLNICLVMDLNFMIFFIQIFRHNSNLHMLIYGIYLAKNENFNFFEIYIITIKIHL